MTGYGRGECVRDGCKVTVEIASVNRRQCEVGVYLPRDLDSLEPRVRDEVNRQVSRGRINVRINVVFNGKNDGQGVVDVPLAKRYLRDYRQLAEELGLQNGVQLEHVLRAPGVLQAGELEVVAADYWPAVQRAVRGALKQLIEMRSK